MIVSPVVVVMEIKMSELACRLWHELSSKLVQCCLKVGCR